MVTGVQTATTELSSGKVTVTGTMDANKLVDYVYRRTKKLARIVPQPEPEPENKLEESKEAAKPAEEEAKKQDQEGKPAEEAKKEGGGGEMNKNDKEDQKSGGGDDQEGNVKEEAKKENGSSENIGMSNPNLVSDHEENMKRMMYYYQPLYMIERIPPPQLFSDENPNACCIS